MPDREFNASRSELSRVLEDIARAGAGGWDRKPGRHAPAARFNYWRERLTVHPVYGAAPLLRGYPTKVRP